ncbi:hypothetical protein ACVBAX_05600 [Robertmurraya sp. GLU-23]
MATVPFASLSWHRLENGLLYFKK